MTSYRANHPILYIMVFVKSFYICVYHFCKYESWLLAIVREYFVTCIWLIHMNENNHFDASYIRCQSIYGLVSCQIIYCMLVNMLNLNQNVAAIYLDTLRSMDVGNA